MTKTTIEKQRAPLDYNGDLTNLSFGVEHYNLPPQAYEREKIKTYMEQQSRTPGHLDIRFALDNRSVDFHRQYGLRWSFHNYTTQDILIIDRLGLPVTIKPETRHYVGPAALIIRKEMYFDKLEVSRQAFLNAQSLGKLHGAELTKMMPELGKVHRDNVFGRHLSLEYVIPESEIRDGDGRLYHLPSDMVVSYLSAANTIRHPCSPEYSRIENTYLSNYPTGELDMNVVFRYISPDLKASPKYVLIANNVFMLKPEFGEAAKLVLQTVGKDKVKQEVETAEYIELLYPAHMDALRSDVKGYRCVRVTLEEACERFGVYATVEEARNPLIVADKIDKEHKDLLASEQQAAERAINALRDKALSQEDELRRQRLTIEELRRNRDKELERIKEDNEKAAHQRKMNTESIKMISVAATTIVTLVGLYLKFKKKE